MNVTTKTIPSRPASQNAPTAMAEHTPGPRIAPDLLAAFYAIRDFPLPALDSLISASMRAIAAAAIAKAEAQS